MKRKLLSGIILAGLLVGGGVWAGERKHGRDETKKVAYLGVATESVDPQLSRHLKLRAGEGLDVTMVDEDSPAAGVLKENDILKELNGQWLVNPEQLRAVVRMLKPGDEASLTLVRDGDVKKVSVKLGEREVLAQEEMQAQMGRGMGMQGMVAPDDMEQMMRSMRGLAPRFHRGTPPDENVENDNEGGSSPHIAAPGQVESHVNVSSSSSIAKDGNTVTLTDNNGEKRLKVMRGSKTVFDGPVSTDAQVKALSPEVRSFYEEIAKGGPSIKVKTQSSGKSRVDI